MDTDRIEKKSCSKRLSNVFGRRLVTRCDFGTWFGVEFDGPFVAGSGLTGRIAVSRSRRGKANKREPIAQCVNRFGRVSAQSVGPLSPGSMMRRISLIGIPPCRTKSLWNVSSLKSLPFALR